MPRLPRRLSIAALGLVLVGAVLLHVAPDRHALTATLIDQASAAIGRDLTIAGGVSFVFLPHPALVIGQASIAGAPEPGGAPLIQVERAEVRVGLWPLLRGRFEANKVRLSGVRIALVRGPDGRRNWGPVTRANAELLEPTPRSPGGPSVSTSPVPAPASGGAGFGARWLPAQGLEVANATLTWEDRGNGQYLALRNLQLALSPRLSSDSLGLTLAADLNQVGEGQGARISASARLDPGDNGAVVVSEIRVQVADLAASEGFAGPLELSGNLSARAGAPIRFDLAVNELDLDAYLLRRGHPAAPPGFVQAPAGRDDLARQLRPADLGSATSPTQAEEPAFPAGLLLGLNLDGRFTIGHLRAVGLHLRAVEIKAIADGGDLRLDHQVADFYGGSLAGALRLDLRGREPQIDLQTAALGFQVGPLFADLTGTAGLTGRGDLGVSLVTAGVDRATLIRALQGTFTVHLRDGALVGVDLAALIEGARLSVAGGPAQKLVLDAVPRTVFEDLSASATAADGVLRSDDLVAHGPWFQARGSGTLVLADGRLDCRLVPVLVKPPQGRGLKELEGVPIPVIVSGTLGAPVWRVDAASALREAARRKLDGQGEDLIRDLDRRTGVKGLGDVLRGLLGH